eukprot:10691427-Heterocapsa_arctica.AAC.1
MARAAEGDDHAGGCGGHHQGGARSFERGEGLAASDPPAPGSRGQQGRGCARGVGTRRSGVSLAIDCKGERGRRLVAW